LFVIKRLYKIFPEQAHDSADLVGGADPVLGGEGIEKHALHPDVAAIAANVHEHLSALFVAHRARQAPLFGAAAVAVDDDADAEATAGKGLVLHMLCSFRGQSAPVQRWPRAQKSSRYPKTLWPGSEFHDFLVLGITQLVDLLAELVGE